jgi:hypothetical protein
MIENKHRLHVAGSIADSTPYCGVAKPDAPSADDNLYLYGLPLDTFDTDFKSYSKVFYVCEDCLYALAEHERNGTLKS